MRPDIRPLEVSRPTPFGDGWLAKMNLELPTVLLDGLTTTDWLTAGCNEIVGLTTVYLETLTLGVDVRGRSCCKEVVP
jgi:hypothetical protein